MTEPISVTALTLHIRQLLDGDRVLSRLMVRGEISNYKAYPSGHHYFTLKDTESSIRCVMFRREAASLRFRPENGLKVVISGRVSVFPRDGVYQLYCNAMLPDGVGELALAFEQLKKKLYLEGLFDPAHKKPLPPFPHTIALVTSPAGAAVRDMIRILGVRYPMADVLVVPVRVQGEEAPEEISAALDFVNACKAADLVIVGRGGGSMEDLWAFNTEEVAYAIYRSEIPVISAVGHEPDVTIADFVADKRASTPSNAAEIAVPDQEELRAQLSFFGKHMTSGMEKKLRREKERLTRAENSPFLQSPLRAIQEKRMLLDYLQQKIEFGWERETLARRQKLEQMAAVLDAISPFRVLGRGYAMAQTESGAVVTRTAQVKEGDILRLRLFDGALRCTVNGKEQSQWQEKN